MSDQDGFSFGSSSFSQSADLARPNVIEGFYNNKHVSFAQKTALMQFMIEHKELALQDYNDEELWNYLTNHLNNFHNGAVRSTEAWKKTWKLWSANVQKKKNDLSITLLDLQLLSFLQSVSEVEKMRNTLKNFSNGLKDSLSSDELTSMVGTIPRLAVDNNLTILMNRLQALEHKETFLTSESDGSTSRLTELMNKKEEIDTKISEIITKLDQNETQVSGLKTEKSAIINEIRNHIRPLYM